MADNEAKIVLSAADKTKAAFDAVKGHLTTLSERAEAGNASFAKLGAVLGSAFSVGAFTEFVKSTAEGLAKLKDLKDATGSSIANLSALEDVALRTGNSFDTVAEALLKLNKGLNAAKPDSEIVAVLNALGLSAKELKTLDPAQALLQIAHAMEGFADNGDKARAAQVLFGKSLQEVAPFLKDLAEKTELVGTVTAHTVEEAKKFSDTLAEAHKNSLDLARSLVGPMLEALNETIKRFKEGKAEGKGFFDNLHDQQMRLLGVDTSALAQQAQHIKDLKDALARPGLDPKARKQFEDDLKALESMQAAGQAAKAAAPDFFSTHSVDALGGKPSLHVADPEAAKALDDIIKKIKERGDVERLQIKTGRDLTDAEKYQIGIMAELNDAHSKLDAAGKARAASEALSTVAAIKFREEHAKATQAMLDNAAAAQASLQAILKEGDARRDANRTLGEQIEEIGLTTTQLDALRVKRLEAAKAQDEQTLAALLANEGSDAEIAAMKENIALRERQLNLVKAGKVATDRESNDPTRGAQRALDDYVDTAKKAGDAAEALTKKTTQGLEDGLTAALTGGKFDIKSFVDEILAEIIRLSVVKPFLASLFGGGSGGAIAGGIGAVVSGGLGALFGGLFADGGTLGAGKWGIAGEAGPEWVKGPAQMVPMTAGGGGVATLNQTNYIDSRSDAAQVAQIAEAAAYRVMRSYDAARRAQGAPV